MTALILAKTHTKSGSKVIKIKKSKKAIEKVKKGKKRNRMCWKIY